MSGLFDFNRAIVRTPGQSVVDGLRPAGQEPPSYDRILADHRAYVEALQAAGLRVTTLPPLEAHPDSMFVEDPALVFREGAILLKPGAPSRAGEREAIRPVLADHFEQLLSLETGCVDGGDVMVTPDGVLIGLSNRTSAEGAEALGRLLEQFGRRAIVVETPKAVLHLKTASTLVDEETVLLTPALADAPAFARYRKLVVPDDELGGANALRVNTTILAGAEHPRTLEILDRLGLTIRALPVAEIGKIDAGLTCMSLRWSAT